MQEPQIKIILDDNKIKKVLKIKDVIRIVEEGFRKKGLGLVNLPPKMGPKLNIPGAFAESMPVAVFRSSEVGKFRSSEVVLEVFGVKWQSAYKTNLQKGLPYLNNLIILNRPENGLPYAIVSGNWITAIRTAGVSAICAKYLAPRKKNPTIGIFGLGLQAYVHVLAFKSIFPKARFFLFNHDSKKLNNFKKKFPKERFLSSNNSHEVVRNSDILITATTFPPKITPYIFPSDLKENVLILPLEYGTRISPALYKNIDEIYTDDIAQYELKKKMRHYFPSNAPKIKNEIGQLIAGKIKKKSSSKKILVFNLGIALFDVLVASQTLSKLKG